MLVIYYNFIIPSQSTWEKIKKFEVKGCLLFGATNIDNIEEILRTSLRKLRTKKVRWPLYLSNWQNCKKGSTEECIFDYITLQIECKINSLLRRFCRLGFEKHLNWLTCVLPHHLVVQHGKYDHRLDLLKTDSLKIKINISV